MNLITSSVDLEGITSPVPRSQFDENELEYLANLFLKSGDTVSPILLHEKSPIAFEVLEGHREYYAALKAQEIDARFESIRAYVVPSDRQDSILEQYRFFHDSDNVNGKSIDSNSTEQKISIADIQRIIEDKINPLKSSLRDISTIIDKKIDQKVTTPPLAEHQSLVPQVSQIETLVKAIADLDKRIPPLPNPRPESQLLKELNEQSREELTAKFTKAGWKGKPLKTMVDSIIETRPYDSFADLTSRKLNGSRNKFFTDATLVKVLDRY